jgi:glycosyltransferase involved in cell wall biosynthesis
LLFVNQHYHPDVASTGQHLTDLAEYLALAGWKVEVASSRGRYQEGRLEAPRRELRGGVLIRRYWTPGFGRATSIGRILDYAVFTAQVAGRLLFGARPVAVILLTTPPMLPALGALVNRVRGLRYGIWSMDLHPEAEVAAGVLAAHSGTSRLLRVLADDGYKRAEFVVVLGRCMRRLVLRKGVTEDRVRLIHVWSRSDELQPMPRADNPLAFELGCDADSLIVMYSGNAGLAHEFRPFLEAASLVRHDPAIQFLFVGGGPRRSELEAFARDWALSNLKCMDYFPRERLAESLCLGDVHLASLMREFEGIAVPGKLYGAMAVGRPIIFLGPSSCETGRTVLEVGCGAVVDPETERHPAAKIAGLLCEWSLDPESRARMGDLGRQAFLRSFEREICCRAFDELLNGCLGTSVRD